jgi:hypothetical protein
MGMNPAGYAVPLQHQARFAPKREGTPPQQAHPDQQPFYPDPPVSAATHPQAFYISPQSFSGLPVSSAPGNGLEGFGGGMVIQPGLPVQYPGTQLPKL